MTRTFNLCQWLAVGHERRFRWQLFSSVLGHGSRGRLAVQDIGIGDEGFLIGGSGLAGQADAMVGHGLARQMGPVVPCGIRWRQGHHVIG